MQFISNHEILHSRASYKGEGGRAMCLNVCVDECGYGARFN